MPSNHGREHKSELKNRKRLSFALNIKPSAFILTHSSRSSFELKTHQIVLLFHINSRFYGALRAIRESRTTKNYDVMITNMKRCRFMNERAISTSSCCWLLSRLFKYFNLISSVWSNSPIATHSFAHF